MISDRGKRKPKVEYPVRWSYKIIGSDVDEIIKAVEEIDFGLEYEVKPSNVSKNEKYFSLNLAVVVPSEVIRDLIFQKLGTHPHIKVVI